MGHRRAQLHCDTGGEKAGVEDAGGGGRLSGATIGVVLGAIEAW